MVVKHSVKKNKKIYFFHHKIIKFKINLNRRDNANISNVKNNENLFDRKLKK